MARLADRLGSALAIQPTALLGGAAIHQFVDQSRRVDGARELVASRRLSCGV